MKRLGDINAIFEGGKWWKIDTSIYFMYTTIFNANKCKKITIEAIHKDKKCISKDVRYNLIGHREDSTRVVIAESKAWSTVAQYIRALLFVCAIKDVEYSRILNISSLIEYFVDKGFILHGDFIDSDIDDYIEKNISRIASTIKDCINNENKFIASDFRDLLSSFFIYTMIQIGKIEGKNITAQFDIYKKKSSTDISTWDEEFRNQKMLIPAFSKIIKEIIGDREFVSQVGDLNILDMLSDWSAIGLLGEEIINYAFKTKNRKLFEALAIENVEYEWISKIKKYSPFDFKMTADECEYKLEVKTSKGSKEGSFMISENELIELKKSPEKFKVIRVNNLDILAYDAKSLDDALLSKIMENINISVINGTDIIDEGSYSLKSKGYYVAKI